MAVSTIKAEFQCEVEKVWELVTSLDEYSWRSDLDKIVVTVPEREFEEHTKDGYVTRFKITAFDEYKNYEFDMENDNMQGHWTGRFSYKDGVTMIEFTENVNAKKLIMKPFVGGYLKKQQAKYIQDLRDVLSASAKETGAVTARSPSECADAFNSVKQRCRLLNRLMWIAITGLLLAGMIFICVYLFSMTKDDTLLFDALFCSALAALFHIIKDFNKK